MQVFLGRLLSLGFIDGFCQPFERLEVSAEGNISLHIYKIIRIQLLRRVLKV